MPNKGDTLKALLRQMPERNHMDFCQWMGGWVLEVFRLRHGTPGMILPLVSQPYYPPNVP